MTMTAIPVDAAPAGSLAGLSMPDLWVGTDVRVPVADGRRLRYADLDQAATTPAFRSVRDTVDRFLDWSASVHRGAGFKSRLATDVYEQARELMGGFVGADPVLDRVVFTRSATESVNLLAGLVGLGPDDVVAVSVLEHHSHLLPWQRLARVAWIEAEADGRLGLGSLETVLRRERGRVRIVALSGASNVTGYRAPIHEAAALAHAHGARISVDAAQLVAHQAIDLRPHDDPGHLDFVSFSGHKMHAPYGAGVLVGPAEVLDRGEPLLLGGGAVRAVTRGGATLQRGIERHEAGSPNLTGAVAVAAAAVGLRELGFDRIARHEDVLIHRLVTGLATIDGVHILGDPDAAPGERGAVVAFVVDGVTAGEVTSILSAEWAVGARDGAFCAHPYLDVLSRRGGLPASALADIGDCGVPGAVRLSCSAATRTEDVERALDGVAAIASGDRRLRHVLDPRTGKVEPVDWHPVVPEAVRLPTWRRD
jgi:selenocysteine lyase/cysteine desulfurase